MIHMLQCLCGPERHCIMGILYDDKEMSLEDAKRGLEAHINEAIQGNRLNRRCEICDKWVPQFWYEDCISKEQDWAMAIYQAKLLEEEQRVTQIVVKANRKAGKN